MKIVKAMGLAVLGILAATRLDAQSTGAWSAIVDGGGRLTSTAASAFPPTPFGLAAVGNGAYNSTIYVEDQSPANEPRYRFRFYFKTNGWDTGIAFGSFRTRMFTAIDLDGGPGGSPRRLVMVALRYCPSGTAGCPFLTRQYGIVARIWNSAINDYIQVGPYPIISGWRYVEGDWKRATAPGANDGTFELWIDGVSQGALTGLANETLGVDSARLGLIEPLLGHSGTLFLDEFESRRQTYIGALP
jgi:hypothetical protein